MSTPPEVRLREVRADDLPIFFAQQLDPGACAMAAFPSRPRRGFDAHWQRVLQDPLNFTRTILTDDDVVAGNIAAWGAPDEHHVGYWLGREHWGRGVATAALTLLLTEVASRPLFAVVAEHNAGSLRVLEKCGFRREGAEVADDDVTEIHLACRA